MEHASVWHEARQYKTVASEWIAEWYRTEALRRRELREQHLPDLKVARKAARRARIADPKREKAATHKALGELRAARRRCPDPLWVFLSKSALAAAVAGYAGLPLVPETAWLWTAAIAPVVVTGALVLAVAAARRRRPDTGSLVPSAEEKQLLRRLAPEHWRAFADARGLEGTVTGRPALTEAGITCHVRLDGKWTVGKLQSAEDNVRALLGCATTLRMEIKHGSRGGWALLILRTRSAADAADLTWTPERIGVGIDTVTGEPVAVPFASRMLLAGSSGAGKSVTLRPLLAELAADPKSAVAMIDLKRVEGALWKTRARVARTDEEAAGLAAELAGEMMTRLEELEDTGRASWTPTAERPRIVLVVDEGAEVLSVADKAMDAVRSIARMGRAAEIHLWWCTQKPTMSGSAKGIDPQVAAQADVRLCLKVATATEVRTVLGEDASAEGWDAHKLRKPGYLLIRGTGREPHAVRAWYMDDAAVRALPSAPIWHGDALAPVVDLRKPPAPPSAGAATGTDNDTRVLYVVREDGAARHRDIVERTGLAKATVSRAVARLVAAGRLVKLDDGTVALAGGEGATA